MPQPTPNPDPKDRASIELKCLAYSVIPLPEDNGRKAAKAVALILVTVWSLITLSLTLESVAAVQPPFYWAFTALVFLLIGRLWDLEVEQYLPGNSR